MAPKRKAVQPVAKKVEQISKKVKKDDEAILNATKDSSNNSRRSARTRKSTSYNEVDESDDIQDLDFEIENTDPKKKKKSGTKSAKKKPKSIKKEIDDEDAEEAKPVERTLIIKGRAAVDSLVPIASDVHVYEEGNDIFDCMLNQTNIQFNNNKFFICQVLEHDTTGDFYTWFRWGRVGVNGQNNLIPFGKERLGALAAFKKKFKDKTVNEWHERDEFEKVNGKYDLVHVDYAEDQTDGQLQSVKEEKPVVKECTLEDKVRSLVELICNVKMMEAQMFELKYDGKKAPLGKLTKAQVKAGYSALKEISDIIGTKKFKNKDLLYACNDFYTRIPHVFGMKVPPLISTPQDVKQKIELLDALGDIQIAMEFLGNTNSRSDVHPADTHYEGLNCELTALDSEDARYKQIDGYVKHGKAVTHHTDIKIKQIYMCEKTEEKSRYKSDLGNRQLLWHGSRLANWAGILSQGLRIAPPEAPVTGYMFGKGIYFADMVSKSANYCHSYGSQNTGLLALCEVALGTMHEQLTADSDLPKHLPKQCHSVRGVGRTVPLQENAVQMDPGVTIPMGPCKDLGRDQPSAVLYNEFVVYDVAQVKLRFLVQVEFDEEF